MASKTSTQGDVPCLRITLESPAKISKGFEEENLKINVMYEGLLRDTGSQEGAPPIIFHKYGVMRQTDLVLHQLRGENQWIPCVSENGENGGCIGFAMLDAPPMLVKVGEDEQFLSLRAGESVIVHQRPLKHEIPEDAKAGDRFLLILKEARVEWWDWGDREQHANTEVYLPCWRLGRVIDPPTPVRNSILCPQTKNEGRANPVVHIGEPVEFALE
ncbi:hypothetical protein G7054_g7701 [Neopestalotiopsis clavispora]|nr:hypothetical protein G7054_g7701 [Neopestalotiopsis clavispora]